MRPSNSIRDERGNRIQNHCTRSDANSARHTSLNLLRISIEHSASLDKRLVWREIRVHDLAFYYVGFIRNFARRLNPHAADFGVKVDERMSIRLVVLQRVDVA